MKATMTARLLTAGVAVRRAVHRLVDALIFGSPDPTAVEYELEPDDTDMTLQTMFSALEAELARAHGSQVAVATRVHVRVEALRWSTHIEEMAL